MSNIDKQWLQQKIADMEATRDEIPFGLDEDDSNTLAALRIALASLEAEPVAPVSVPETLPCPVLLEPGMRFGKGVRTQTMLDALQRRSEYFAELEAMTTEQRTERDAGIKEFAAMLQGKAELVTAHPELTVWYGSMPETNGKTNWTAMLHRKGHHPWEGITIDRSEYPERVRYEADRMRHLIGELTDEPDILAYDADAHSGYAEPVSQRDELPYDPQIAAYEKIMEQAIPDGYALVPVEPTEDMIVAGFESRPDESFSKSEEWEAYQRMSGCEQAAHRAKLCWAAMLKAAPQQEVK